MNNANSSGTTVVSDIADSPMPLVSVIVPNYNHERFLEQRLQSIFMQTVQDYEVILLDDCSSDNSQAIIQKYQSHPKVSHIIINAVNSGSPFLQWSKGIACAKGEWIWVAESDDFCDNTLLEKLVKQAQADDEIVLSYSQSKEVDEEGKGWRDLSWHSDKIDKKYWKENYINDGIAEIKKCLWYYNTIPNASAVLFRKKAYMEAEKDFAAMRLLGDWMLWVQLLKKGKIAFCAEALNSFRTHVATTRIFDSTLKLKTKFEEEYAVAANILSTVRGIIKSEARKKLLPISMHYCTLFTTQEIFGYMVKPWTFKKSIPLHKLIGLFFLRMAKRNVQKLFS